MKNQIERRGAPDAAAERLARFIAQKESLNCKTLDDAVHHQSKWQRIVPEAKEMLEAAYPNGAGHVVLLEALRMAKREMVGLAAYMETCEPSVIVDNLPSLAKALNLKVDAIEAVIQKAEGR